MKPDGAINKVRVQTNVLPKDISEPDFIQAAKALSLFFRKNEFVVQNFFTTPQMGRISLIEGMEAGAEVHFREIHRIGPNIFHIRLIGHEKDITKMTKDPQFFTLMKGISNVMMEEKIATKKYLDTTTGKERWFIVASLDKKNTHIANFVNFEGKRIRIANVIILGDLLFGLTENRELVRCQLNPDIIEKQDSILEAEKFTDISRIGQIDKLEYIPYVEDAFIATIKNKIFQITTAGYFFEFDELDETISKINAVQFNNVKSIFSTDGGLFEVDLLELPNVIKVNSLPRQIIAPYLKDKFNMAMYIEDPYILGIPNGRGIIAKTEDERVLFF